MMKVKLLTLVFALIFALICVTLIVELYARLFAMPVIVDLRGNYSTRLFEPDTLLGYRLGANRVVEVRSSPESYDIRTNAHGHRGPEYTLSKPEGTLRIMILGDSFGYGLGLPYEKTLAAILAEELNGVEILNTSVPGYATTQEYLAFKRDCMDFDPDLVIIMFCPNDVRGNISDGNKGFGSPYYLTDEAGNLVLHGVPVEPATPGQDPIWIQRLLKQSAGYRLIRFRLSLLTGGLKRPGALPRLIEPRFVPLVSFHEGRRITIGILRKIGDLAISRGAPTLILSTITKEQIDSPHLYEMERLIAAECEENNDLAWLDLLPAFEREAREEVLWLESNGHWNESAHRIASRLILTAIREKELLPQ